MAGVPTRRCRAWAIAIGRGRRAQPSAPGRSCRAFIGSLEISRLGSVEPTMVSATITSKHTWMSSPSASTGGVSRWPPSRPCWDSLRASTARRPTICCTLRSQPDRHNGLYVGYAPWPSYRTSLPATRFEQPETPGQDPRSGWDRNAVGGRSRPDGMAPGDRGRMVGTAAISAQQRAVMDVEPALLEQLQCPFDHGKLALN